MAAAYHSQRHVSTGRLARVLQNIRVLGKAGSFAIAAQEGKAEKLYDSNPRAYPFCILRHVRRCNNFQ